MRGIRDHHRARPLRVGLVQRDRQIGRSVSPYAGASAGSTPLSAPRKLVPLGEGGAAQRQRRTPHPVRSLELATTRSTSPGANLKLTHDRPGCAFPRVVLFCGILPSGMGDSDGCVLRGCRPCPGRAGQRSVGTYASGFTKKTSSVGRIFMVCTRSRHRLLRARHIEAVMKTSQPLNDKARLVGRGLRAALDLAHEGGVRARASCRAWTAGCRGCRAGSR